MSRKGINGLSQEEVLVLILSRPNLSGEAIDLSNEIINRGINPIAFLRYCDIARTSPLVYRNIRSFSVSDDLKERLKARYLGSLRYNLLIKNEVKSIISSFSEKCIEAIPLKGSVASEQIFKDVAIYPGSDIDLLVRPSDLEVAREVLTNSGYRAAEGFFESDYRDTSYHLPPYMKDGFSVELHWNLMMRYFHSSPDFWWEEIEEIDIDGDRFLCLSPERYILYAIFRLFSHAFYPLKFHVLVAGLIDHYRERIHWEGLLSMAEQIGMEKLLGFTLSIMREFFEVDVPVELRGKEILMNRIGDMVLKGLFDEEPVLTRRMIIYSYLQGGLRGYLSLLLRRLFPSQAEIRSRYGIKPGSKRLIFYYLMNPFYLFFGKK